MGGDDLAATARSCWSGWVCRSRLAALGVEQADIEAVARLSQALQPAISWDEDTVAESCPPHCETSGDSTSIRRVRAEPIAREQREFL